MSKRKVYWKYREGWAHIPSLRLKGLHVANHGSSEKFRNILSMYIDESNFYGVLRILWTYTVLENSEEGVRTRILRFFRWR